MKKELLQVSPSTITSEVVALIGAVLLVAYVRMGADVTILFMVLAGDVQLDAVHHARNRHLYLVFLGRGAELQTQDQELTEIIRTDQGKIFSEDLDMLEQQQRNLLAYPERRLLKLNIDAGGVQSRRFIERLITAEQNAQTEDAKTSS